MSSITSLPKEILFQCASQNLDSLRSARETCSTFRTQIDEIWKTRLATLWEEWQSCKELKHLSKERFVEEYFPSFRFVFNWKEGKAKISLQTFSGMLKNRFGFNFEETYFPDKWTEQDNLPYFAFVNGRDLSIFNMQSKLFLGEICDVKFKDRVKPIFYNNGVFLIISTDHCNELHYFELSETQLFFKKKMDLPKMYIDSFHLISNYIYICYPGRIEAISVNWISSLTPAFLSIPLEYDPLIFEMNNKALFKDRGRHLCFQHLYVADGELKYTRSELEPDLILEPYFTDPYLYTAGHFAFFKCLVLLNKFKVVISAIPTENLNSSLSGVEPFEPDSSAMLVKLNESVILCSTNDHSLQFHRLTVVDGKINRHPLNIPLEDKFHSIMKAYVHLDKLFLIGVLKEDKKDYLFIFNMKAQCLEIKHPLNFQPSLPNIIASRLGRLYLSCPESKKILEILY